MRIASFFGITQKSGFMRKSRIRKADQASTRMQGELSVILFLADLSHDSVWALSLDECAPKIC